MSNLADRITRHLMEWTENAYRRFQRRFNIEWVDELPLDWLADTPHSIPPCNISIPFTNLADAMEQVAELYRKALWADADVRFEICEEDDASDGYAPPIARLYACRGFNSLIFINDTAEAIYHCGAYQACGAADRVAETLVKLADELILAQRLAVMPEQIAIWPERCADAGTPNLSPCTRPTISATTSVRSSKSICRSKSSKS